MEVIYKYPLEWQPMKMSPPVARVIAHEGAEVLCLALQKSHAMVWVRTDPSKELRTLFFVSVLTGQELPDDIANWKYAATLQEYDGSLITHIYWRWPMLDIMLVVDHTSDLDAYRRQREEEGTWPPPDDGVRDYWRSRINQGNAKHPPPPPPRRGPDKIASGPIEGLAIYPLWGMPVRPHSDMNPI